ncbi:MAG: hypothetical protein ACFFHV_14335 [Promethearchaeota archaeon]
MEIDIDKLKESSLEFNKKLRLPINTLNIKIEDNWKNFTNFISELIEIDSGRKFKTELSMVLIDTGNEANFIVMSAYYLNTFKSKIKEIDLEQKIIEDFVGNERLTEVTTESFEFKIFNALFKSKIGFTYQTNVNALDIINVGINAIRQYLNLIFLAGSKNYYYCSNI